MSEVKTIYTQLVEFNNLGDFEKTETQLNKLVDNIFSSLNTNGDNVLGSDDDMNTYYKKAFGLETSGAKLTRDQLKAKIEDIAYEVAMSDEEAPTAEYDLTKRNADGTELTDAQEIDKIVTSDAKGNGYGVAVAFYLIGDTTSTERDEVKKMIEKINADNVVGFFKGFTSESHLGNDFLEQVASEGKKSYLTNGVVLKVLRALVERFAKDKKTGDEVDKIAGFTVSLASMDKDARFQNPSSWWSRMWGEDLLDDIDEAINIVVNTYSTTSTEVTTPQA